jgi:CRISP-associated protein Cas1
MHDQATEPARDPICVAHGYGLKIYVHHGQLVVEDGIFDERRTRRYSRATSRLKRLFIIGHTGFVTLESLRWLTDTGAAFAQIGNDGQLIATSAPARHHEAKLRRAQVLAADNELGRHATVDLLRSKLHSQAEIVDRLSHLKRTVRVKDAKPITVAEAIRDWADLLQPHLPFARMREIESSAGRAYWQTWTNLAPSFDRRWDRTVPNHWRSAGPRTSWVDRKRARKAATPVHAILNYTYAILEVEATIAAHAVGFDPSLGIMHADHRYRGSLATDLMEPSRPVADGLILDLLDSRPLRRGDVLETRQGVCRIGPTLAHELARLAPELRAAVAPHAEWLVCRLLQRTDAATPLTRRRHRAALTQATSRVTP